LETVVHGKRRPLTIRFQEFIGSIREFYYAHRGYATPAHRSRRNAGGLRTEGGSTQSQSGQYRERQHDAGLTNRLEQNNRDAMLEE